MLYKAISQQTLNNIKIGRSIRLYPTNFLNTFILNKIYNLHLEVTISKSSAYFANLRQTMQAFESVVTLVLPE